MKNQLTLGGGVILHRYNTVSKKLKSVNIDSSGVVELYQSLINHVDTTIKYF